MSDELPDNGLNSPQTDDGESKPANQKDPRSLRERIIGGLELIPVVGKFLAFVPKHWGFKETGFLIVGFFIGWTVVYFGKAPEFVIAAYRSAPPAPEVKPKPTHIDLSVISPPPDWLQQHIYWLENEGNDLKAKKVIDGYRICNVDAKIQLPSTGNEWIFETFRWELKGEQNWELNGFAFTERPAKFMNSLASGGDAAAILFTVPNFDEHSKLTALVRLSWKAGVNPPNCGDIHSSVK